MIGFYRYNYYEKDLNILFDILVKKFKFETDKDIINSCFNCLTSMVNNEINA